MDGDGSESMRGRVGIGVKSARMGGDGTKIPFPCTPLVWSGDSEGQRKHLFGWDP